MGVRKLARALVTVVHCMALVACMSAPSPPEVYSGTQSRTMMFPLVDSRVDGGLDIEECAVSRPMPDTRVFMSSMSELWYAVDRGVSSSITREDLDQRNTAHLQQIPSGNSDYVAFLFLEQFSLKFASFKYRLTAFVLRPDTGEVVWTRTNEDSAWQGVLGGPLNKLGGLINIGPTSMSVCQALSHVAIQTFNGMPRLPAR